MKAEMHGGAVLRAMPTSPLACVDLYLRQQWFQHDSASVADRRDHTIDDMDASIRIVRVED